MCMLSILPTLDSTMPDGRPCNPFSKTSQMNNHENMKTMILNKKAYIVLAFVGFIATSLSLQGAGNRSGAPCTATHNQTSCGVLRTCGGPPWATINPDAQNTGVDGPEQCDWVTFPPQCGVTLIGCGPKLNAATE